MYTLPRRVGRLVHASLFLVSLKPVYDAARG
jgi:hypothetical protein